MAKSNRGLIGSITELTKDESLLKLIHWIENLVAKVLSLTLTIVIFVALVDLIYYLLQDLADDPKGFYNKSLVQLFGAFLNILIALELLENITAYLKKHVVQVELVIVTSLIAVARKIIIFDLEKYSYLDLIALGAAILCLAVSYWLVKRINAENK